MSRTPTFTTPDLTRPMFNGMPEPVDPSIAAGERKAAAQSDMLSLVSDIALGPVALGARGLGLSPSEPLATKFVDDHHKAARREATDSVVRSKRATTPQAAVEARAVPRASIAELNALDIDQIRERFSKGRYDDRGPVTRFLDLLDLPRNTIAGLLAPSIQKRKQAEGETGTFGRGTVRFSDILDDLGVENRVIRGVAGFVGDVALDPLTYVGPAGWGAKIASKGGQAASVLKRGNKIFDAAIKAAETGSTIKHAKTAEYIAAKAAHAAETGSKVGYKTADEVATALRGGLKSDTNRVLRWMGEEKGYQKASELATDALDSPILATDAPSVVRVKKAAKALLSEVNRDNAPGLRFGRNAAGKLAIEAGSNPGTTIKAGTGYLHVPFTDLGIYGPAISERAKMGIQTGLMARSGVASGVLPPDLQAMTDLTQRANTLITENQSAMSKLAELDHQEAQVRAGAAGVGGASPVDPATMRPIDPSVRLNTIHQTRNLYAQKMSNILDELRGPVDAATGMRPPVNEAGLLGELAAITKNLEASPTATVADTMFAQNVYRANLAVMNKAMADYDMIQVPSVVREKWQGLHNEFEAEKTAFVNEAKRVHNDKEIGRKALHDNEVAAVNEANQIEEARRVMSGEVPHPVLGPDPFPEVAKFEPAPFDETMEAAARAEADTALRPSFRARLDERRLTDIFDMSPETVKATEQYAQAFHAKMAANIQLAHATGAPLFAAMSGRDAATAAVAKSMLGLGGDQMGHAMFAPIKAIAEALTQNHEGTIAALGQGFNRKLSEADAALRTALGRHGGSVHNMIRNAQRANSPVSNKVLRQTMAEISRDLKAVFSTHNLNPEERMIADRLAGTLVSAGDMMPFPGDAAHRVVSDAATAGIGVGRPTLIPELRKVAEKWRLRLKELGAEEVRRGLLGSTRENYGLSSLVGRNTAKAIAERERGGYLGSKAGITAENVLESYQKPRSTDVFKWFGPGPDGSDIEKSVMEADRIWTTYDDATLATMDSEFADGIRKLKADFKELDSIREKTPSKAPIPQPASRDQVNEWVRQDGRFKWLTGGDVAAGDDFFETSLSQAVANRYGASYRNYLNDRMMEFAANHGVAINMERITNAKPGPNGTAEFTMNNGAKGSVYKSSNGEVVVIGDQRFRKLNRAGIMASKYDPTAAALGDGAKGIAQTWFPEAVADMIEKAHPAFKDEDTIEKVLKGVDELNTLWKTVTLMHPSWTINDILSGTMLALRSGVTPAEILKHAKTALRVMMARTKGDNATLDSIETVLGGRKAMGSDLARGGHESAVFGGSQAGEVVMQLGAGGHLIPAGTYSMWKNPGKAIKEQWNIAGHAAEAEMMAREAAKSGNGVKKARQWRAFVKDGVMRQFVAPWFHLNGQVNDWLRLTTYMAMLDKGYSAEKAAAHVAEHLFDMSTMTSVEQNIRRYVPFYSWMKNSGVYGMRMLMEDPKFFRMAPNVKHALEEAFNGEQTLPEHQRPSFMRDQQAVMWSNDEREGKAFLFGTMLPTEMAAHFGAGLASPVLGAAAFQDMIGYFTNSISPALKIPLEIGSKREAYSGRSIGFGDNAGDMTGMEYLLSNVRPLKEAGVGQVRQGPLLEAFDKGVGSGVARVLQGGRLQEAGAERVAFHVQREFKQKDDALRSRIARSESAGNKAESLRARIEQLQLHKTYQMKGVTLPKWSQQQLGEV